MTFAMFENAVLRAEKVKVTEIDWSRQIVEFSESVKEKSVNIVIILLV